MTPIALQITLPTQAALPAAELVRITGRATTAGQLKWLKAHAWAHELSADGAVIVGQLYAHLRLAGFNPTTIGSAAPAPTTGFDLAATR